MSILRGLCLYIISEEAMAKYRTMYGMCYTDVQDSASHAQHVKQITCETK